MKHLPDGNWCHLARTGCLALTVAITICPAGADGQTIDDFDGPGNLSLRWTASGNLTAQSAVVDGSPHPGVAGRMVRIDGQAGGNLAERRSHRRRDYDQAAAIRFRARSPSATEADPLVIEVQVHSADRRAWFWRKVTIVDNLWKTYELPLRFFRHSRGARLSWVEAQRLLFRFRNAGRLDVDGIELVCGGDCYLSAREVAEMAMGDAAKISQNRLFALATNDDRLQRDALLVELGKLSELVREDLPHLRATERPAILLVFARRIDYQQFWPRLAAAFNSTATPVTSDGYVMLGIAGASVETKSKGVRKEGVRPVYIQEACHAMLAVQTGISNRNEWMHEGLANYYQLKWSGQNIHEITTEMIGHRRHVPLSDLLSGRALARNEYAQAVSFVAWLLSDDARRRRFGRAIEAMARRSSTDLREIAPIYFGYSVDQLETQWLGWADTKVGALQSSTRPQE